MHQPFELKTVIHNLASQSPSSLFVYSDQLFVGCADGSLYIYSINTDPKSSQTEEPISAQSVGISDAAEPTGQSPEHGSVELVLLKSIVNFSFRATGAAVAPLSSIEAISVIKETNSLVTLSAGNIALHDLNTFKLQSSCEKWTKLQASAMCLETSVLRQNKQGVVLDLALIGGSNNSASTNLKLSPRKLSPFSTTIPPSSPIEGASPSAGSPSALGVQSSPTGPRTVIQESDDIPVLVTLLAVPCKRRLVLFCWKDGEWLSPKEINLPHQVRSLVFATPLKLFLGYSTGDYATVKLGIPSDNRGTISHEMSEAFPSPIAHLVNRAGEINSGGGVNAALSSGPSIPASKMSGLSGLAFKKGGLVSLGLAGSAKVEKNPLIKVGPPTHEVIGMKEQLAAFLNYDGKLSRAQNVHLGHNSTLSSIIYPAQPSETVVRPPYVLSLLPPSSTSTASLSVHSIPTLCHIQNLQLPSFTSGTQPELAPPINTSPSKRSTGSSSSQPRSRRLLTPSSGNTGMIFMVASEWNAVESAMQYQIECLQMKPWGGQIQQLLEKGEYEESLALMEGLDTLSLPNKATLEKRLNALCAVINFSKHKYNQAIDTFISLSINPAKVVALYPSQISGKLAKRREEWEQLFDGRSIESYLSMSLDVGSISSAFNEPSSQSGSDVGSKPSSPSQHMTHPTKSTQHRNPTLLDDDRGSIRSCRSQGLNSLKGKPSELSIQKPVIDVSQDSHFRPSVDVLIRYLTDRRQNVNKAFASLSDPKRKLPESSSDEAVQLSRAKALRSPEELFQLDDRPISEITDLEDLVQIAKIIDTTLFKCYLAMKPTMLGPLCRLPNWCEVDEVETLLMNAKRYQELLDLYHGKNLHDQALNLLKKMGENEADIVIQIDPTIRYLQKLGPRHLDLILNTAEWVFSRCADSMPLIDAALEIFTADLSTVESLPRPIVMSFLEKENMYACRLYLEHLIGPLKDQTVAFHEKLIHLYIIEFKQLRSQGSINGAKELYDKLLTHLLDSKCYSSNWVLGRLPQDDMYEARALTLGKMGQHDAALTIYVHRLGNIITAEEYCKRVYSQTPESGGAIFLSLLKIYLRPTPSMTTKGYLVGGAVNSTGEASQLLPPLSSSQLLDAALKLISDHGNKIGEIAEVLELLPSLISLDKLQVFVLKSFRRLKETRKEVMVVKECAQSRLDELEIGLKALEGRRVKIEDKRLCIACGKRLGNSVIAVHPPYGEVTHYQCRERYQTQQRRL